MQQLEVATPHRLTVAEYMTADLAGRTELIGGVVCDVAPRNEPHRHAVRALTRIFAQGLAPGYSVQVQDAVAVPSWHARDAPEVDVAIIADRAYDPMLTSAGASLFIEVSDSTYRDDREVKIPLYVNAGVPAWIVNIPLRHVECYESTADLEAKHGRVYIESYALNILGVAIPVTKLFS